MVKRLSLDQSLTTTLDEQPDLETDIHRFKTEHKVPQALGSYVYSLEEDQACCYEELSNIWPEEQPSPEEAAKLVFAALKKVHIDYVIASDLEGFLLYYGLPAYSPAPPPPSCGKAPMVGDDDSNFLSKTLGHWTVVAEHGPRFLLKTLPVEEAHVFREKATDLTVFVEFKELGLLPTKMLRIISQRRTALADGDVDQAEKLLNKLNDGEYEIVTTADGVRRMTKKYQIKLRGINVLDIETETRDNLVKKVCGKRLTIAVYDFDDLCKHWVADVYCDNMFLLDYC